MNAPNLAGNIQVQYDCHSPERTMTTLGGRRGRKDKKQRDANRRAAINSELADQEPSDPAPNHKNRRVIEEDTFPVYKPPDSVVAVAGVLVGIVVALIYGMQLWVMQRQLDAMRRDQRAWVSADIAVKGPLTFTQDMAFLPIDMVVTNVGHSPAQYVAPWTQLIVGFAPPSKDEIEAYCKVIKDRSTSNGATGWTLFPGQHADINQPATVRRMDIDDAIAKGKADNGKIGVSLIACVDYKFTSDDDLKDHQTRQGYAVGWLDPSKNRTSIGAFDPLGQYAPIAIYLQPMSFAD
jgi:hypothetical protein